MKHIAEAIRKKSKKDRMLAENDTYPPGAAESDTQAQDEGFGEGEMDNTEGNMDQEMAREEARKTRMQRAMKAMRKNPGKLSTTPQGDL